MHNRCRYLFILEGNTSTYQLTIFLHIIWPISLHIRQPYLYILGGRILEGHMSSYQLAISLQIRWPYLRIIGGHISTYYSSFPTFSTFSILHSVCPQPHIQQFNIHIRILHSSLNPTFSTYFPGLSLNLALILHSNLNPTFFSQSYVQLVILHSYFPSNVQLSILLSSINPTSALNTIFSFQSYFN